VVDIMQATPEQCAARSHACIASAAGSRNMLSAGCEVLAETPDEVFRAFCAAVCE